MIILFPSGLIENGFGLTVQDDTSDINVNNNRSGYPVYPQIQGIITGYSHTGGVAIIDWEGDFASGVDLNLQIRYTLNDNALFYATTVTITNNGSLNLDNVFFHRNMDPDNNVFISSDYSTINKIESQISSGASARVSASSTVPFPSYIAFESFDPNVKVSYGGFSNRDAADIWNGVGFTQTVGSVLFSDIAISLAYRTQNLAPGATVSFTYYTIFDNSVVGNSDSTIAMCYNGYDQFVSDSIADSLFICGAGDINAKVCGTNAENYEWNWFPAMGLNVTTGLNVVATVTDTITYTATGIDTVAGDTLTFTVVMIALPSPNLVVTQPSLQCSSYDLGTLVYIDSNFVTPVTATFHTVPPSSASDMSNLDTNTIFTADNTLYMMLAAANGCYSIDTVKIDIFNFYISYLITPTDCGMFNGQVEASLSSFDGSLVWGNGDVGMFADFLAEGWINVTITDTSGICSINDSVYVPMDSLLITTNYWNETCFLNNGMCSVVSANSVGPLSYLWSNGATANSISGLNYGTYFVTVTNPGGCVAVDTFNLLNLSSSFVLSSYVNPTSCWLCTDGFIVTGITGGYLPVTYTWSTGDTTPNIFGLAQGCYSLTTSDASGCSEVDTFCVLPPLGVNNFSLEDGNVSVYPNPSNDFVNINSTVNLQLIKVFTTEGKCVSSLNVSSTYAKINVSNLENGVYILKIETDIGSQEKKLLIVRDK